MVYTRLGDLEDEDEDILLAQDETLGMDGVFQNVALVSPSAAIFLTSVIEYIAEQTLLTAGQAAYARTAANNNRATLDGAEDGESSAGIVVEVYDVEKLALNPSLGRIWRTWRKRIRSPTGARTPSRSRQSMYRSPETVMGPWAETRRRAESVSASSIQSRRPSTSGGAEAGDHVDDPETDFWIISALPLPMTDNDVAEIEVPGLAKEILDESVDDTP
ncbi:hypothetical protein LTS18_001320, partial [Coniosporium uncinatum]